MSESERLEFGFKPIPYSVLFDSDYIVEILAYLHLQRTQYITPTSSTTENRKTKKAPNPTEKLVKLASARLQQPQDDHDKIAAAWTVELREMDPQQQLFAKKVIMIV